MKKMFCVVAVFASVMQLWAKTEQVDGITWSYREADGIFTSFAIVGLGSNGSVNSTAINTATKGAIQIPASLGGLLVEEIERYAFYNCTNITSVTIPNRVKSIGNQAFYNCTNLISVTLPHRLSSIGSSAFGNCVNLKNVLMPLEYTGSTDEIPLSATILRYKTSQYVTLNANGGLLPWSGSPDYVSALRITVSYGSAYGSTPSVGGGTGALS